MRFDAAVPLALLLVTNPLAARQVPDPTARSGAIVRAGDARFTVLTDRLVRMEWAEGGAFEDRGTLVVVERALPVPIFRAFDEDGWQVIETGALRLRYRVGSGRFGPANLEVRVATGGVDEVWRPGRPAGGNLGGTIRTLDGVKGPVDLGDGLLSRDGWAVVDDSESPLLVGAEGGWAAARPEGERQDWYFLGYGHDYRAALGDFARVSGRVPMPPRFAFGIWWSRYWAYTDTELQELVGEFDRHDVPLDVLVVDMDWHETFELRWSKGERDAAGQRKGWTGYTWNPTFFPDPEAFLAWAHGRGLRTTLNLHPASGIQPWEAQYPAMAPAVGVDPETKAWIPFHIEDRDFARAYFDHVIHPLERQGVDFWWLDWQQWGETSIPGLNPTMWLNHVFFGDMERQGKARPLIFHRFGGLGSHRYQVGFSGDAASTWEMLAFEPEFTSTASNVLYGFWSHDIGGHLPGPVTPELYTRWIQFGALSPVLRTHTTKNPDAERRIWAYPPEHYEAMRDAMLLRTSLVPYLYTAARATYDTGVGMLRPLYYHWPEEDAAYTHPGEYMLGEDLLVSPIGEPADSATGLATRTTWLPPGEWIEWGSGARLQGPSEVVRTYLLHEIPLFARAGAILPMQEPTARVGDVRDGPIVVKVFAGRDGTARLYEDAGNDLGYRDGASVWTELSSTWSDGARGLVVRVGGVEGGWPGMARERALTLCVPDALPPTAVESDGAPVPYRPDGSAPGWSYDGARLEVVVRLDAASARAERTVSLTFPEASPELMDGLAGTLAHVRAAVDDLERLWPTEWPPETLIDVGQVGHWVALNPDAAVEALTRAKAALPGEIEKVRGLEGAEEVVERALAVLGATPGRRPPRRRRRKR
jgi:alpha-glucosidase